MSYPTYCQVLFQFIRGKPSQRLPVSQILTGASLKLPTPCRVLSTLLMWEVLAFYINIQLLENMKINVVIILCFFAGTRLEKSRRGCVTVFRPAPYRDGIVFKCSFFAIQLSPLRLLQRFDFILAQAGGSGDSRDVDIHFEHVGCDIALLGLGALGLAADFT